MDITIKTMPWQAMDLTVKTEKISKSLKQVKEAASNKEDLSINKACAEFESLFISQLFKEMRATIPKSDFISGGKSEEIYTGMLDSEIAKEIASNRGIGLSALIRSQLESEKKDDDKNILEDK